MSQDDQSMNFENIFGNMFGPDTRTPEERERDAAEYDKRYNEIEKEGFERAKAERRKHLSEEYRIKKIVREELNQFYLTLFLWGAVGYIGYRYGMWSFFAAFAAVWGWQWNSERKAQLKPECGLDDIDDLAEDTVTHERIVELEHSNQPWLALDDECGPECGRVFDHPYWSNVNAKVRDYRWKSHKDRLSDNARARAASLPFRKAKRTHVHSVNREWELPYWCSIRADEAGKG